MDILFFESEISLVGKMIILPVRSTIIKTSKGIVIISPIKFTDEQFRQIESLGSVTDIISPSLLHHLFLPRAKNYFKEATVWGPPGCKEKLPEIKWSKILTKDTWPYENEIDLMIVNGCPEMNEVVFLEKRSKTLIVTDLVFNLTRPKGWGAPIMLRLLGTYKKFAVSRFIKKYLVDQKAFLNSVKNILNWQFTRVVMAHGEIVSVDGKNKFAVALETQGYSTK
jgi:hypothetical protein